MAILKCKMCGGDLEITQGESVCFCAYCGTKQTLPRLDDEKKANMYDRANHFRRNNEFDKAMSIYEQILEEDREDAESYWSLVLCTYGIEYVEDPTTHKRVPTVNRAQYTSVLADENYKSALKYADAYQRQIYEDEAGQIDEIQKGILEISNNEQPFDVFICYKETDAAGQRTQDSVLANDLYHQLTQEGFRVFFARITLEDKLGSAYEPYIFAALNSAKVMVVLGTKPEYFNAVWVKNEWSRFLKLAKNNSGKALIPAYKDMDPYDLPQEFSHLQSQDMAKLGFMQDLIRGIKKLANKDGEKQAAAQQTAATGSALSEAAPLVRRAFIMLEDGDFTKADELAESALNLEPENAEAYLVKLMVELKVRNREDLAQCDEDFGTSSFYNKIMRFGDEGLKTEIGGYLHTLRERKEEELKRKEEELKAQQEAERRERERKAVEQLENDYQRAVSLLQNAKTSGQVWAALQIFQAKPNYKDSTEYAKQAQLVLEKIVQKEKRRNHFVNIMAVVVMAVVICVGVISYLNVQENERKQTIADAKMEIEDYIAASEYGSAFAELENVSDIAKDDEYEEILKEISSAVASDVNAYVNAGAYESAIVLIDRVSEYASDEVAEEILSDIVNALMKEKNYVMAASVVTDYLSEYVSENALSNKLTEIEKSMLQTAEIGDNISFGSYEGSNIEWTVLDKQDDEILLFSKSTLCEVSENYDAVEQGVYDTGEYSRSWAVSNTRAYMNGEFYDEAFSETEKSFIKCSTIQSGVVKNGVEEYFTSTTDDYLFELSYSECMQYYSGDSYTETQHYFLRSVSSVTGELLYAYSMNGIYYNSIEISAYIRPAMWVSITP